MQSSGKYDAPRDIPRAIREDSRRRIVRRLLPKLCEAVMILGLLNFILFLAGAFYLGGDAVNGKVENGRYYVWGYSIGEGTKSYTEVSKSAFDYSDCHAYSVMATWPLMFIAGIIYKRIPSET